MLDKPFSYYFRGKPAKKSDLTDVSKPLKSDKEKKADALANIDINNYAS